MSGVRKPSPLARGRNHGLELSLMFVLQVNSGTMAAAKEALHLTVPSKVHFCALSKCYAAFQQEAAPWPFTE